MNGVQGSDLHPVPDLPSSSISISPPTPLSSTPVLRHSARLLAIIIAVSAVVPLRAADSTGPNVVFILADDLRADALGFAGGAARTPNLDRLAARGAVFTRATCSYPICHVSRSEIFSGRLLLGTGREALKFDPTWILWPEQMKRAGWHTVYSGKWHVSGTPANAGFVATAGLYSGGGAKGAPLTYPTTPTGRTVTGYTGWTFKDERGLPLPALGVGLTPHTDRIIADRAIAMLSSTGAQPFFLQVNFTAPHDPLFWPPGETEDQALPVPLPNNFRAQHPFDTGNIAGRDELVVPPPRSEADVKRERALYFRQVENVDRQIGRIVQALADVGRLERTIIIFSSDHGLALGSHGLMGKQNQYEHTINVPLVMAGPGIPTGRRFVAQSYLRDLYPTICDLTGISIPDGLQGASLAPVLRGEVEKVRDAIFGNFTDTQRMLRENDGWKLIWYPQQRQYQLFNVSADPDELRDRVGEPEQQGRLSRMRTRLEAWQREHQDPLLVAAAKREKAPRNDR